MNTQKPNERPLFPHPPVQRFRPPVIPQIGLTALEMQEEGRELREHSGKLPQKQGRETQAPESAQLPHLCSCQDVRMVPGRYSYCQMSWEIGAPLIVYYLR